MDGKTSGHGPVPQPRRGSSAATARGGGALRASLRVLRHLAEGLTARVLTRPLLFPSLSPTVFAHFQQPPSGEASTLNAVAGRLVAVAVGFASHFAFVLGGEQGVPEGSVPTDSVCHDYSWAVLPVKAPCEVRGRGVCRPGYPVPAARSSAARSRAPTSRTTISRSLCSTAPASRRPAKALLTATRPAPIMVPSRSWV